MHKMTEAIEGKYGIKTVRRIRGDGNCYYRAVYYAYFELIINKGKPYLRELIELYKIMIE